MNYYNRLYNRILKYIHPYNNSEIGEIGECSLFKNLCHFENQNCKFLFNLYIPKFNNEYSEIDMLMITKKGIIVIESKNYQGWIFGKESQYQWTQTLAGLYGAQKYHFYNPIIQNKNHINSLKKILPKNIPIFSVIAFSDKCEFKNVRIGSTQIIINYYRNIASDIQKKIFDIMPDKLTNSEIYNLYNQLFPYTQNTEEIKEEHIYNISEKYKINNDNGEINYNTNFENSTQDSDVMQFILIIILLLLCAIIFFIFFHSDNKIQNTTPVYIPQEVPVNKAKNKQIINKIKNTDSNITIKAVEIPMPPIRMIKDEELKDIEYIPTKADLKRIQKQEKRELKILKKELRKAEKERKKIEKQQKKEEKKLKKLEKKKAKNIKEETI